MNDPGETVPPQAPPAVDLDQATRSPAYAEATARPSYAQPPPAGDVQVFSLVQLEPYRHIRLEAPTVFGRSPTFFRYPAEEQRFTVADAEALERLDYILIEDEVLHVSRTHGVLDPRTASVRDLNSKHGIRVNGKLIARNAAHPGPPHALEAEDLLRIGSLDFLVQLERVSASSLLDELAQSRSALVGPAGNAEAEQLGRFLSERKRFRSQPCGSYAELFQTIQRSARGAPSQGVLVIGLVVEPLGGDRMRFGDEEVTFDLLLFALASVPGSKVIALQAKADPSGLEAVFRDLALQDTILLTSTVSPDAGLRSDALEPDIGSMPIDAMRRSVAQGLGTYDSVLDGLDSLICPDSNVLDVDWVERFEGSLRLIVGTHVRQEEFEVELSYQPSDPVHGSFRVRHNLSSDRSSLP